MKKARRIAAARGRALRVMFADEARFGRMNRPRPCWAPTGVRPKVACQLVREFIFLYGAIRSKDGASAFLILPSSDSECFQIFLDAASPAAGLRLLPAALVRVHELDHPDAEPRILAFKNFCLKC